MVIYICPHDLNLQLRKDLPKYPTYNDLRFEIESYVNRMVTSPKVEIDNFEKDENAPAILAQETAYAADLNYASSKGGKGKGA